MTTYSYTMHDDTILSSAQIEGRIREVERALATIERAEKTLGRLGVDGESVRLALRDLRAHYIERRW